MVENVLFNVKFILEYRLDVCSVPVLHLRKATCGQCQSHVQYVIVKNLGTRLQCATIKVGFLANSLKWFF